VLEFQIKVMVVVLVQLNQAHMVVVAEAVLVQQVLMAQHLSEVMAVMALLQQSQVLRLQEQAEAVQLQIIVMLLVLVVLVVAEVGLMEMMQLQLLADNQI